MIKNYCLLVAFISVLLWGCTIDSDSYYFDEESTERIQVEAFITRSFDENAPRFKTDTIAAGDSVIFLSSIQPIKTIRSQTFYWTIDGDLFAKEYSFSNTVKIPGLHEITFVLVDYFGDTTRDMVHLYVANPPLLDKENFIPANNTQSLQPDIPINFTWNGQDPDNMWDIQYHFTLEEFTEARDSSSVVLVDTILGKPSFTSHASLRPLTKYRWSVSATNNLHQVSSNTLSGNFFTSGSPGENGILSTISTSSGYAPESIHIIIEDIVSDTLIKDIPGTPLSPLTQAFSIKPLPSGNVRIIALIDSLPDYVPDTLLLNIQGGILIDLPAFYLQDKTAPQISSLDGNDSLDIADTIKIIIHDGGGKISLLKTSVTLDGSAITGFSLSGDTLQIPLHLEDSWSYRVLNVSSMDYSGNRNNKAFYIRPNTKLSEVF